MSEVVPWARVRGTPPANYVRFIERGRDYALARGLSWSRLINQDDAPVLAQDWDLRQLADGHDRHAITLGSFEVDVESREMAVAAGWSLASMPSSSVLSPDVQEFVLALVVERCRGKKNLRAVRQLARNVKVFFSVTGKAPWDVSSEDVSRYVELRSGNPNVLRDINVMSRVVNEHLISVACPIVVPRFSPAFWQNLQSSLRERVSSGKLPERGALYELARIVLRETPRSHLDLIRFCVIRVILFTGLRLNEVLMLPADCLRWEKHVDVVTGLLADQVGGYARTLSLRYFAEKQAESAPDLLVEDVYPVPERFQETVATAIAQVQAATAKLRKLLAEQMTLSKPPESSDLRRFKTTSGTSLTTADLLFLTSFQNKLEPCAADLTTSITTLSQNSMYLALGVDAVHRSSSLFARYGAPECSEYVVRPHSLRHLLNTELFRLGVPDTVITQQFGRQTVAQSYEYDHRTLSEKLAFVRLPDSAKGIVRPGSSHELVAKMVVGGLSPSSHMAKTFATIQASSGDEAAFQYLVASSDGFHVTPYGFCLNSFSMSPCPKHLKCFHGCKHFTASGLPEHRVSLQSLKDQLTLMREAAAAKPARTVGRKNQIAHADALLVGVAAALAAQPNAPVFGGGIDFSVPTGDVLT